MNEKSSSSITSCKSVGIRKPQIGASGSNELREVCTSKVNRPQEQHFPQQTLIHVGHNRPMFLLLLTTIRGIPMDPLSGLGNGLNGPVNKLLFIKWAHQARDGLLHFHPMAYCHSNLMSAILSQVGRSATMHGSHKILRHSEHVRCFLDSSSDSNAIKSK